MYINPLIIVFGIAGLFLGFLVTPVSRKIISNKCEPQNKEAQKSLLDGRWFQIIVCISDGILCAAAALKLTPASALLCSVLFTLAILFAVIDIRIRMIPNELLAATLAAGILFQAVHFGVNSLITAVLCMLALVLIYLLVGFILGLDKIGAGDVKLAGVMGLVLGYPSIVTAIIIMSVSLILYCVIGIWIRKLTLVSMFPFAPFMMLGMIVSLCSMMFQ